MTQRLYWLGNAAKSRVIDEILTTTRSVRPLTIFDYGCGDGGDWPSILSDHPEVRLVGYEPHAPSFQRARARLNGHATVLLTGKDIDTLAIRADYIVSFSVFEHVANRAEFLRHAKRILAQDGVFYLNYDDGHFRNLLDISRPVTWLPALRAWARTMVSKPGAWLGLTSHFQFRVTAEDADRLVAEAGFRIERIDYHNLHCLKELAKVIPETLTADYATWWLNAERLLNERFRTSLPEARYGDRVNLWQQMLSRTLLLKHR